MATNYKVNGVDIQDLFLGNTGAYTGGTLWVWGCGLGGELGDGTIVSKSSPIQIGTATNWKSVYTQKTTTTTDTTFAIKTDGSLWVWGNGNVGQLGLGSGVGYSSPVQLGTLTNWKFVMAHSTAGFGIKTDNTLWAWGSNGTGTLGLGDITSRLTPVQVGTLANWKYVCGHRATIAIKTDGTLWGWGENLNGEIGDGTIVSKSSPVQIGASTNWNTAVAGQGGNPTISTQGGAVLAIKTDGTLWSWGRNLIGQLGLGDIIPRSSPTQVGALTNWKEIAFCDFGWVALKTDGTLWSCGQNAYGDLGVGDTITRSSPVQIGSDTNWKQVNAWFGGTRAVKTDGTLWSWGRNDLGQLGLGLPTTTNVSSPMQIGALNTWKSVFTGGAIRRN